MEPNARPLRVVRSHELAKLPWTDTTIRPNCEAEVETQPDGTVEVSWALAAGVGGGVDFGRLTILLSSAETRLIQDQFAHVIATGRPRRGTKR